MATSLWKRAANRILPRSMKRKINAAVEAHRNRKAAASRGMKYSRTVSKRGQVTHRYYR